MEKSPLLGRSSGTLNSRKPVLVIHGDAGTMTRQGSSPERRELYKAALRQALLQGHRVLQAGGEAMDAAVAAAYRTGWCSWAWLSAEASKIQWVEAASASALAAAARKLERQGLHPSSSVAGTGFA